MALIRSAVQAATPLGVRVRVPLRLGAITTIGEETAPPDVGLRARPVERIWTAVQALYRTGLHPGIALVVRHRGQVIVDRAIGTRVLDGDELMTTRTPACLFSCSKSITALLIHRLAQDGRLSLDDPVAQHLPEFAQNGKQRVTIRALLTHRAGLAKLPMHQPDPEVLLDFDEMVRQLCAARLTGSSRQAYHAVTSGYILGELSRRVTGRSLPQLLRAYVAQPLGCTSVTYGVAENRRDEVALSYTTGPRHLPPYSTLINRLLGMPAWRIAPEMNTPKGMSAIVPSANIYASAEDACRIFQMLLDGGRWGRRRVLHSDTVAAATQPAGPLVIDASLPAPIRFSPGFMLGERVASLYGVNTPRAFGHLGFTSILCWADPARELSVSFINTGKSVSPEGFVGMAAVSTAISAAVPPAT